MENGSKQFLDFLLPIIFKKRKYFPRKAVERKYKIISKKNSESDQKPVLIIDDKTREKKLINFGQKKNQRGNQRIEEIK